MDRNQKMLDILSKRKIIGGEKSNLMAIRPIKYEFARDTLTRFKNNTWDEREVDLSADKLQYDTGQLHGGNLIAYKKALAFLSNLDGMQLNNLTYNIGRHVTAPEITMCLVRQAWEEAQHVLSYSQMIESIGFDPVEVYWMFEEDGVLAKKNEYIMQSSMILGDSFTPRNFLMAIAANIILEGVYFYNGFLTFYALERQGLMCGSAKMIKLIQRDEVGHLNFFVELWHAMLREHPSLDNMETKEAVYELFRLAVDLEKFWGRYIIQSGVSGLSPAMTDGFIESTADTRLGMMKMRRHYNTKNPVFWFDDASRISKENFFEAKVSAYQSAGAMEW